MPSKPARPKLSLSVQYAVKPEGAPKRAQVRRWLLAALDRDAEVAVRIVGEEEGRMLNRDYRHKDYATNVLTFCYDDLPEGSPLMGDLVLCAPVVEREAGAQGKGLEAHYCHLLVHGALHLLGHEHEEDAEARRMEALEIQIVTDLGYPDPYRIHSPA